MLEGKSPYKVHYGSPQSKQQLHVLGCLCFAIDYANQRNDNFSVRWKASILMGFSITQKGYLLMSLKEVTF